MIANGEAINILRSMGVPEEQLMPVAGGERVPLFTREVRTAAAKGEVAIASGPPSAPRRPAEKLAVASVHVWPSLHCLMPGTSHADIPDEMDTGKVRIVIHWLVSDNLSDNAQEYVGGATEYACTVDITFGMKYGLFNIGQHVPEGDMDDGLRSFFDYINGPARECMSHFDGGQLMYNFLLGEQKTLMWSAHLGAYDGVLKRVVPKPNVLIQAIAGRANLNGRPFDGSAAQFAVKLCQWLGEPEKLIWCLHDNAPIKPWTVNVQPATEMITAQTRSRIFDLPFAVPVKLFES